MRFSSGSATRSCISCAVAPGHTAATVNTLIVKVGSSARPSSRKAKMPAATIAMSKNSVIAFSRTARAERLKNCFASDVWCLLIGFCLGLYAHALAIAKEMNSDVYDLLSAVQVPADGCEFFTQSAYLYRLKCHCGCR